MSETYTTGCTTPQAFGSDCFPAQSFAPIESHTLNYIKLKVRHAVTQNYPKLKLYHADIDHKPIGLPISESFRITPGEYKGWLPTYTLWKMSPIKVVAGGKYVIVAEGFLPTATLLYSWYYDQVGATYPRGRLLLSTDAGGTWTSYPDQDHYFAEWGDPPLPKPEPQPPLEHFAIPAIQYTHLINGLIIRISTSVPCHLTCYYTDTKPLKHPRAAIIRGLSVPWETYFCFVNWKAVEQTESGDSLYHTFEFAEWPPCLTIPPITPFSNLKDIAPFLETWGTTLTENYPWGFIADPLPPGINLTNGILTLTFTGTPHSGIFYNPPPHQTPLLSEGGIPLHLVTNNTEVHSLSPFDNIVNMVQLRKDGHYIALYFMIKGSIIGFGSGSYGYEIAPPLDRAWWYIGTGKHDINLLERFQQAAKDIGIDPDPTGWFVNAVEIAHADPVPIFASYLKNDYIGYYHPAPLQVGGRYFTFRGNIDDALSPSIGPIFTHCHDGVPTPTIEEQTQHDTDISYNDYIRPSAGQRLTIPNRTLTKLAFVLRKVGAPTGNVTFIIKAIDDDETLASKVLGDASALQTTNTWEEVTFDAPATINEEVKIYCHHEGGDPTDYIVVRYQNSDVKENEYIVYEEGEYGWFPPGWYEAMGADCTYKYTYFA